MILHINDTKGPRTQVELSDECGNALINIVSVELNINRNAPRARVTILVSGDTFQPLPELIRGIVYSGPIDIVYERF